MTPAERANDVMYRDTDCGHKLSVRDAMKIGEAMTNAIRQAVAEEREACAKVAERFMCNSTEGAWPIVNDFASRCVQRIRERK